MRLLASSAILLLLLLVMPASRAADPANIDRTIRKEPAYRTKAPKYGLLAFGPEGKHRIWLVRDGDVLYVDRNGNGDLTEPGEKVAAEKNPGRDPGDESGKFDVGDLTVAGRTHKGLFVSFSPLKHYSAGTLDPWPGAKAALANDPKAAIVRMHLDVQVPGVKGGGIDGRLSFDVGPFDLNGVLCFAGSPAEAPVIRFGGPLQVTFYDSLPSLRVGRSSELVLVVGTPGVGAGTFAVLGYEATIPETAWPVAEVTLPSAKPGAPPLMQKWVLKNRC
jgi:hypothetical protein